MTKKPLFADELAVMNQKRSKKQTHPTVQYAYLETGSKKNWIIESVPTWSLLKWTNSGQIKWEQLAQMSNLRRITLLSRSYFSFYTKPVTSLWRTCSNSLLICTKTKELFFCASFFKITRKGGTLSFLISCYLWLETSISLQAILINSKGE